MARTGTAIGVFLIGMVLLWEVLPDGTSAPGGQAKPPASRSAASETQADSDASSEADPGSERIGNGDATFVLRRSPDSHFYADAEVNGATIHFLVDTSATAIVLTPGDARRAGIGGGDFTASGITAGGKVSLMPATAQRIALGPLTASNVPVLVAKDDKLPISLLGQSYLSRIGTVSISGDAMTLQ